jgi:hypothetical protein
MTSAAVWVKLVIDGDDSYDAFPREVPLETYIVDDLKKSIMVEAKHLFNEDIHSLKVYPPGTNPVPEEGAESLPPYLPLSDPGFPKGVAGPTPLIVTAKIRQPVSLVVVSCRYDC